MVTLGSVFLVHEWTSSWIVNNINCELFPRKGSCIPWEHRLLRVSSTSKLRDNLMPYLDEHSAYHEYYSTFYVRNKVRIYEWKNSVWKNMANLLNKQETAAVCMVNLYYIYHYKEWDNLSIGIK